MYCIEHQETFTGVETIEDNAFAGLSNLQVLQITNNWGLQELRVEALRAEFVPDLQQLLIYNNSLTHIEVYNCN